MVNLGHLDVNVVTHCNQRCVSCSHASPFTKAWQMAPEALARDLKAMVDFVRWHRIQMVGGEPLLHSGLVEMIKVARESGIATDVSVITNGRLLPRMADDFWASIDILQLSIYPTLDKAVIDLAARKCAEFGKAFCPTVFSEFHRQFRAAPGDGSNFHSCHWKSDCWTVHDGYFALCPQSLFFPKEFMGLDQFVDCLSLAGVTEELFNAFINHREPLNACRICCANELNPAPWAEAKTKDAWLAASTL